MNTEDHQHIDELIGNVLEDNVPADVDRRLRSQLENFRLRVDVATAVLKQPWIHIVTTDANGKTSEGWHSSLGDISASRDSDRIEYRERGAPVYYSYDVQENILYRVPEFRRCSEDEAEMIASIRALLQEGKPIDKPLEHVESLFIAHTGMNVVKQSVDTVETDGREWLDYHLTVMVRHPALPVPEPMQILFRVDPQTKSLQSYHSEGPAEGKMMTVEARFDYPENGPADIYDLGVPKTAKLVDRVPTHELAQILETIRAGRQHMDDYRAIIVNRMEGSRRPDGRPAEVICRKGDRFRRDNAFWIEPTILNDPKIMWPTAEEGASEWWNRCVEDHCFLVPVSIDHGSTSYRINIDWVTDPDGTAHVQVTGVETREDRGMPGEVYPGLWSEMPEFACRPPMGIPSRDMDVVLDPSPKEGPPGTILLHKRYIGRKRPPARRNDGTLLPHTNQWLSWLDPARDYAVVRHDMITTDESGKEEVHSTIIDEMARSPHGTWYAMRIRRKGAIGDPREGKTYDEIIDLYVDFNADLPDSLFEPPAPGRIR